MDDGKYRLGTPARRPGRVVPGRLFRQVPDLELVLGPPAGQGGPLRDVVVLSEFLVMAADDRILCLLG